ncbi:uncharacterized protein LOC110734082 [Chenopodium quinoa]|uniref:uncharacterized protein LOC110734082 n=1 Tax=Chenopodium quinoa TaxID=63459 RepID=UPI000B780B98|nr:uncharacterized protein LOC110734082 [Chenopodium quinoa]
MNYDWKLMSELQQEEDAGVGVRVSARIRWKPPSGSRVKVNVDAGVWEGLGSSVGAVVRRADGSACAAMTWMVDDRWAPNIAEAKALLFGLQMPVDLGYKDVVMESDCLGLINAVSSRERGSSTFHLILDDVYHVSSLFESIRWSFVRREGNRVAHELAHCMPWAIGKQVWSSTFPECIVALLNSDLPSNES